MLPGRWCAALPLRAFVGQPLCPARCGNIAPLLSCPQDHLCPHGDEASAEADFFGAIKAGVGQRLALLESPDDLVAFFGALAEGVITSATSAPAEGEDGGADASSVLGVYLRMVYARYTAMSYEVGWRGWEAGALGPVAGLGALLACG